MSAGSRRSGRLRSRVTVGDLFLLLLLGGGCLVGMAMQGSRDQAVSYSISVDGRSVCTGRLAGLDTVRVTGPLGETLVEVSERGVAIVRSPCPLHLCEAMGPVSRSGAVLVCVPNRVVVELQGGSGEQSLDAVVR